MGSLHFSIFFCYVANWNQPKWTHARSQSANAFHFVYPSLKYSNSNKILSHSEGKYCANRRYTFTATTNLSRRNVMMSCFCDRIRRDKHLPCHIIDHELFCVSRYFILFRWAQCVVLNHDQFVFLSSHIFVSIWVNGVCVFYQNKTLKMLVSVLKYDEQIKTTSFLIHVKRVLLIVYVFQTF